MWRRTDVSCQQLTLTYRHVRELLGCESFGSRYGFRWLQPWHIQWLQPYGRLWARTTQIRHSRIPDLHKWVYEIINVYCFRTLHLSVACNAEKSELILMGSKELAEEVQEALILRKKGYPKSSSRHKGFKECILKWYCSQFKTGSNPHRPNSRIYKQTVECSIPR